MSGKKRRQALGQDWVDAYAPAAPATPQAHAVEAPKGEHAAAKAGAQEPAPEPGQPKKVRAVFYLPDALLHEARNAVVHLAGYPEYLNLTKLAERAIRNELERLRKEHTEGKPFPSLVVGRLKGGRPVGS